MIAMRVFAVLALFPICTAVLAQDRNIAVASAKAETRVALLIGNSTYKTSPLMNPANDASDLAYALEKRGFNVLVRENVGEQGIKEAVDEFAKYLKRGGIGLFFFAGHGIQSNGENYLMPVDIDFDNEAAITKKSVSAEYVLSRMADAGNRVNIVILDACRNNPFQSGNKGLAVMNVGRKEKGTFIAYATSPGSTAADGTGRNGLYTKNMLQALDGKDSDIDKVFGRVRGGVVHDTDGAQVPWTSSSIIGNFYFDPNEALLAMQQPAPAPAAANNIPAEVLSSPFDPAEERAFWESIKNSQNAQDYQAYLQRFGGGPNVAFAKFRLQRLGGAPSSTAEPASEIGPSPPSPSPPITQTVTSGVAPVASVPVQIATIAPTSIAVPPTNLAANIGNQSPGTTFRDCPDCPELIVIPAGEFLMGSTPGEPNREPDEGPQHSVRISAFALGKYEVTRAQFAAFMRDSGRVRTAGCHSTIGSRFHKNPQADWQNPGFSQGENEPVVCVSWEDADAYVAWLSKKYKQPYRLPSEAEWEYAARAGGPSGQYWQAEGSTGSCKYASVADQSVRKVMPGLPVFTCNDGFTYTAPVGRFQPNKFGLHDMLGNVWEWVGDCWNENYKGAPSDGSSKLSGECSQRVFRGGAWNSKPVQVRTGFRDREEKFERHDNLGFRVARSISR